MRIGRNDPCVCGSGEKFKKCCQTLNQIGVDGLQITYEPLSLADDSFMDKSDAEQLFRLTHDIMEHKLHKESVRPLERLHEKYPQVPRIYNFLTICYVYLDQEEKAEQLVFQCYERFPEYPFAKFGMALHRLSKGKFEKVAEILPTFDLRKLFPHRKIFHASEVSSLFGLMGLYYLEKRNVLAAAFWHDRGRDLDYPQSTLDALSARLLKVMARPPAFAHELR